MAMTEADTLDSLAARVVDEAVGENLDQLATLDMRGDGVLRVLYRAARAKQGGPLVLAAARALHSNVGHGQRVLLLTGFLSPKPYPETDGLTGSAVLAAALERSCAAIPVFVCEPDVAPPLMAALRGAGLNVTDDPDKVSVVPHGTAVIPFAASEESTAAQAAALARAIAPVACVAIERPGANSKGQYHFAMGKNVTPDIARLDLLYEDVARHGALTIGIGDFGNELGMGAIYEAVRAETPAGRDCGCGCGGGTACPIPADVTVVVSVSDWGAYAISACLAHLSQEPTVLVTREAYRRIMQNAVAAGAIDGPTRYAVPDVDGVEHAFNAALVEVMRAAARYPSRADTHSALRMFRARRVAEGA